MTNAVAILDHSNADLVDTALQRLTHLLKSPEGAPKEALETAVACLSEPADPQWVMARTAALLNPYYEKDVPQGIRVMEAEDWADALSEFPQWAIQKAAQWWKSADNPDRRKRPMEGDIAARARHEMQAVTAAKIRAASNRTYMPEPVNTPRRDRVSPDQAAAILADVGFKPKRIIEPKETTND